MITSDRGYGKEEYAEMLSKHGFSSFFNMPDNCITMHPFVTKSYYMNVGIVVDEEVSSEDNIQQFGIENGEEQAQFVISDGSGESFKVFGVIERRTRKPQKRVATAIRENGSVKFSNVVRFVDDLPTELRNRTISWD